MSNKSIRTVYGASLQSALFSGAALSIPVNTTLNQKFDILNGVLYSANEMPKIQYLAIGIKGHRATLGPDNVPLIKNVLHTPRHSGLYEQIPFVVRDPDDDLTPSERLQYRGRKLFTTGGGLPKVAYYLKKFDPEDYAVQMELRTTTAGVTSSEPFVPLLSDLNPVPPAIGDGSVLVATGDYVVASNKVPFVLTTAEIEEIRNACLIIKGDVDYAFISEIGVCSGVDKVTTGDFNGATENYTEAVCVQITNFIATQLPLAYKDSVDFLFDIGSVEPMMANA